MALGMALLAACGSSHDRDKEEVAEPLVVLQVREVLERVVVDAQGVLEPRVRRPRIDPRRESQLRDPREPLERGRVHDRPHPRREGDVLLQVRPPHRHDPAVFPPGPIAPSLLFESTARTGRDGFPIVTCGFTPTLRLVHHPGFSYRNTSQVRTPPHPS